MLAKKGLMTAPAAVAQYVEDVFSTYLYTGDGSFGKTITNNIDISGEGGMVWVKKRGSTTGNNVVVDTTRGKYASLYTNSSGGSTSAENFTNFTSSGFVVSAIDSNDTNQSSSTYASWTFRKAEKFFDVVTYTGNGSNRTISHNLGSVPGCIIVKRTDTAASWRVYHRGLTDASYFLSLNLTEVQTSAGSIWNSTAPTSTVFSVGTSTTVNESGGTYVAYLFAHDAGGFGDAGDQSVIKCGSYTGNGSTNSINLGYEPQWLLIKRTDNSGSWVMLDIMRGLTVGQSNNALCANTSSSEAGDVTVTGAIRPTSTGFDLLDTNASLNASGGTYIYIAIRRGPMKTPEAGTEVFKTVFRSGTSAVASITGVGFTPDSVLIKNTLGNSNSVDWSHNFFDRLRNPAYRLSTTFTDAEDTSINFITSLDMDGLTFPSTGYTATNGSGYNYVNHFFKRAPKFFDTVCYTGTGTARTVSHNLGIAPELMIVRRRDTGSSWYMWGSGMPMTNTMFIEQTSASADNAAYFNDTSPTSSVFSVNSFANTSGATYIAYLFATCPGVSKVGTYVGNGGTAQNIDCGFTSSARFVLIKSTGSGNWFVFNSVRGINDAGDRYLMLNSVDQEDNSLDIIDPYSSGFAIANTTYVNTNGVTFIYLAIA